MNIHLNKALTSLCLRYIDDKNDWYSWTINDIKLPLNVNLPNGNNYVRNIALKTELYKLLSEDTSLKHDVIPYYISVWGGVKTNSAKTMQKYVTSTPEQLTSLGKKGIASWSKALTIQNPHKYAIFDARVSISLNYVQLINNTEEKTLFPILSSRNKKIVEGSQFIKAVAKQNKWKKVDETTFYSDYLNMLSKVSREIETDISTVEMLLFAKAEELVDEGLKLPIEESKEVLNQ